MINIRNRVLRFRLVVPQYPAFNIYSSTAKETTALGPVCVASTVNKMEGWSVEIVDENNLGFYGPRLPTGGADHDCMQRQRPADAVGFYGGLTSTAPRIYEIARFYKEKGIITIAGGQHFVEENINEALSSGIDYVVMGEGEETIKELLRALEGNRDVSAINGIAYLKDGKVIVTNPRPPITDFEKLPSPNFSLVRYANIKLFPVSRIRGCGMDCEFCTVRGKPRCASPEKFLEDISFVVETFRAKRFFIVDDLFAQYRDETLRFCRMLEKYQQDSGAKLDFLVQIRLDKARDTELLGAMRSANIKAVAIGIESPIEQDLDTMKKHIKPKDMVDFARVYHDFGFLVHGMFIFGYPYKDNPVSAITVKERVRIFNRFIKKAKIDTVQVLLPVPLPGTELRKRLKAQNRVYPLECVGWEYYDGNFPVFEPDTPFTPEEMQGAIRGIMGRFYNFKYMLAVAWHVFSFPRLSFSLHNIKDGWRRWYRNWRNSIIRFGGWMILKGWVSAYNKSAFSEKLNSARCILKEKTP